VAAVVVIPESVLDSQTSPKNISPDITTAKPILCTIDFSIRLI